MSSPDLGRGLACAAVAVLFFGSNFLPVKNYETDNGIFFQWVLAVGIWSVGLVVNVAHFY